MCATSELFDLASGVATQPHTGGEETSAQRRARRRGRRARARARQTLGRGAAVGGDGREHGAVALDDGLLLLQDGPHVGVLLLQARRQRALLLLALRILLVLPVQAVGIRRKLRRARRLQRREERVRAIDQLAALKGGRERARRSMLASSLVAESARAERTPRRHPFPPCFPPPAPRAAPRRRAQAAPPNKTPRSSSSQSKLGPKHATARCGSLQRRPMPRRENGRGAPRA